MPEPLFKWLFFAGFMVGVIIRKSYTRGQDWEQKRAILAEGAVTLIGQSVWGIAQIMALFYIFSTWLSFADYTLIPAVQWVGLVLFYAGVYYLWASHAHLSGNWTPLAKAKKDSTTLVSTGVYKRMRHPMYTAHILWSLGQALLLGNWLVGPLGLLGMVPMLLVRIPREERELLEKFGEDYTAYMARTSRLWPKWSR